MEYEKNKDIQLLTLSGTEYVLVRRKKYDELLDKLEAIDTALDLARSRTDASEDLLQAMLKEIFPWSRSEMFPRPKHSASGCA